MFRRSCFTTANALSSKNSHKNAILSQNSIKRESGLSIFLLGKLLLIGGVCRALDSRVSNFYHFLRRRSVVGCHCGNFPCHKGIHLPFLAINDWHFCLRTKYYSKKKSVSDKKLTSLLIPCEILILMWFYRKNCQNWSCGWLATKKKVDVIFRNRESF